MNLMNILTDRLIIIPVTFKITQCLLYGSNKEIEKLGIKIDEGWPPGDTMDILPIINRVLYFYNTNKSLIMIFIL